jgi:hypothetical protein
LTARFLSATEVELGMFSFIQRDSLLLAFEKHIMMGVLVAGLAVIGHDTIV